MGITIDRLSPARVSLTRLTRGLLYGKRRYTIDLHKPRNGFHDNNNNNYNNIFTECRMQYTEDNTHTQRLVIDTILEQMQTPSQFVLLKSFEKNKQQNHAPII